MKKLHETLELWFISAEEKDALASYQSEPLSAALKDKRYKEALWQFLYNCMDECTGYGVFTAQDILELPQDLLLELGFKTQLNTPIDFKAELFGGKMWKPFNEHATPENGIGTYFTFDTAPKHRPSKEDYIALASYPREWAVYQGQFGYLFDGRLFIPAAGFIPSGESDPKYVGYGGYHWSSAVSGTNAVGLSFYSSWLHPSKANYRGHGFQVRCLQE